MYEELSSSNPFMTLSCFRIKKRIIVNKNVTPLTARPDQCEITIENCCNMNICETVSYLLIFSSVSNISRYFIDTKYDAASNNFLEQENM